MGQHFYGTIEGKGSGNVHAAGTKNSGITGHVRGWDVGARVLVTYNEQTGLDEVTVYATTGSSEAWQDVKIAEFTRKTIPGAAQ